LQIRIADVVKSSSNWRVYLEEHPWRSEHSEGFIDLVIHNKRSISAMIIECKRVRDTAWVFLIPAKDPEKRDEVRLWLSDYEYEKWNSFGWRKWSAAPSSFESQFCAIPGQEHGRQTILERIASDLIEAVEALALQERKVLTSRSALRRIYVPVIITTAELRVSFFEPSSISLCDGSLPEDAAFEIVPYIRFRKSLRSEIKSEHESNSGEWEVLDAHKASERIVFIVNAEKWSEFLDKWEVS